MASSASAAGAADEVGEQQRVSVKEEEGEKVGGNQQQQQEVGEVKKEVEAEDKGQSREIVGEIRATLPEGEGEMEEGLREQKDQGQTEREKMWGKGMLEGKGGKKGAEESMRPKQLSEGEPQAADWGEEGSSHSKSATHEWDKRKRKKRARRDARKQRGRERSRIQHEGEGEGEVSLSPTSDPSPPPRRLPTTSPTPEAAEPPAAARPHLIPRRQLMSELEKREEESREREEQGRADRPSHILLRPRQEGGMPTVQVMQSGVQFGRPPAPALVQTRVIVFPKVMVGTPPMPPRPPMPKVQVIPPEGAPASKWQPSRPPMIPTPPPAPPAPELLAKARTAQLGDSGGRVEKGEKARSGQRGPLQEGTQPRREQKVHQGGKGRSDPLNLDHMMRKKRTTREDRQATRTKKRKKDASTSSRSSSPLSEEESRDRKQKKKERRKKQERKRRKDLEKEWDRVTARDKQDDEDQREEEEMDKDMSKETDEALAKARPRMAPKKFRMQSEKEELSKKGKDAVQTPATKEDIPVKMEVELPGVDALLQAKPSRQAASASSTATKQELDMAEDQTVTNKLREKNARLKAWNAEVQEKLMEQQAYIERQERKLQRARKKREEAEVQLEEYKEWIAEWEAAKEKEERGELPSEEEEEGNIGCWLRKPRVELVTTNMRMLATVREVMVEYGISALQQMVPTLVRVHMEEQRADGSSRYIPMVACRDCMRVSGVLCRFPLPILAIKHMKAEHGRGNITDLETRGAAEAEWGSWAFGVTKHLDVKVKDISPDVTGHSREDLENMVRRTGDKILGQLEVGREARNFVLQTDEAVGSEWLHPFWIPENMEESQKDTVEANLRWLSPLKQRILMNYVQPNEAIPEEWEKALMRGEHGVPTHVEAREERKEDMRKAGNRRQQPSSSPPPRRPRQTAAADQRQTNKARRKGK